MNRLDEIIEALKSEQVPEDSIEDAGTRVRRKLFKRAAAGPDRIKLRGLSGADSLVSLPQPVGRQGASAAGSHARVRRLPGCARAGAIGSAADAGPSNHNAVAHDIEILGHRGDRDSDDRSRLVLRHAPAPSWRSGRRNCPHCERDPLCGVRSRQARPRSRGARLRKAKSFAPRRIRPL